MLVDISLRIQDWEHAVNSNQPFDKLEARLIISRVRLLECFNFKVTITLAFSLITTFEMDTTEFEQRIAVLGGTAVGKSALALRFGTGEFSDKYDPKFYDSYRKRSQILTPDGKTCKVTLTVDDETAKDPFENFTGDRSDFMRTEPNGFLMVYDISSHASFEEMEILREKILRSKDVASDEASDYVAIVIVGNKCDLSNDQRQVSRQEGIEFAKQYNMPFFETSAKEGINIDKCFYQVAREYYRMLYSFQNKLKEKQKKHKKKKLYCTLL